MRRATSTPTPSFGKNVDGGISRHFPCAIHTVSITPPSSYRERAQVAEGSQGTRSAKTTFTDVARAPPPGDSVWTRPNRKHQGLGAGSHPEVRTPAPKRRRS